MSDSNSDQEDKLAKVPFSWIPPRHLSTFSLFLSKSSRLSFLVIDDPISKQRIERIIKDYGGKVCVNVVYGCSVVLVPEDTQPLAHWGAVYSRRWVRDSITACSLKELNKYLIKGCAQPTVKECQGSLTSSLFFEKFEFRQSPLASAFFRKDLFTERKDDPDVILFMCRRCRNVKSPKADVPSTKSGEVKAVSPEPASPSNDQDNIVRSDVAVSLSNSSNRLQRDKASVESSPVKQFSSKVEGVKKVVKRKLANLEDLINVGDSEEESDQCRDRNTGTVVATCSDKQQQSKPTCVLSTRGKERPQQIPADAHCETSVCKRFKNDMKNNEKQKLLTGSSEQTVDKSNKGEVKGDSTAQSYRLIRVATVTSSSRPPCSDSDSDNCISDLRNLDRFKKFQVKDKHSKVKYSRSEKEAILKFIVKRKAYNRLKSDALYREMEERNICPRRTYQSMKNHFAKILLRELDTFEFLSERVKMKLRGEANIY